MIINLIRRLVRLIVYLQNVLVAFFLLAIIFVGIRLYPHPPLSEGLTFSTAYYDDKGELLRLTLAEDSRYRLWTKLEDISPDVINGIQLHEDQFFYYHPGFNPISLLRAVWVSYIGGGNKQGASTLTMQLARMHWKLNTRTISGKIIQIFRAIQLELMYSKHDILEAYLNYAPYGRNIESIGAASLIYFNKTPQNLTLPESLTLAVLPQSPTYRVNRQTGIVGEALTQARNRLFERWQSDYPVTDSMPALFNLPLILRQPEQLPFTAPHFINQIIESDKYTPNTDSHAVLTTLDSNLQTIIERQVAAFIERNSVRGMKNASVLLIDTQSTSVKALVGSADYFNVAISGQVNGTTAQRSPGSTLKPFIYALGFDQGILHPMTILKDVETDFGFYTPENFDRRFRGPISATEALIYSRNIPAVYVASKLKNPSLYDFLQQGHIDKLASEEHYGLSLVLGGGEISPQELGALYTMLANQGQWHPLRFTQTSELSAGEQLLTPQASFMTMDMLRQNIRRQDILSSKQANRLPVYWKTGTSWGFRDAWSVGIWGPYVLVVWMGNFDNSSNNAFVGADAAAPLFFNIIDSINAYYPNLREPKLAPITNLKRVDICLASGNLLTQWCQQKGTSWFIPGVSPITIDTIYRPVLIDNITGAVACPPYNKETSHIEVYEYWPSDLAKVFARAGIPKRPPPDISYCKSSAYLGERPRITSPLKNVVYQFRQDNHKNEQIFFTANADGDAKRLYWFINNSYLGQTEINNSLEWTPTESGVYKVIVTDDLGRTDSRQITVEFVK
ncbi:penicillin-binding protein 1C [Zophobihabitans entericus]|uniref:peptidoglycan glycosyltransferase n=1 Tax=Zophobihabitans entericus TaxID=1635327 RepID=A0A6G9ICF8_9GAMM|nr:penicillin-binding protein 1C [Zophobihabitans entericus]QIQ21512.1 penicillin-binding protein 1C [Zophobihabitans entericus]